MVDVRVIGLTLARGKLTLTVVLMKSDVLDLELPCVWLGIFQVLKRQLHLEDQLVCQMGRDFNLRDTLKIVVVRRKSRKFRRRGGI